MYSRGSSPLGLSMHVGFIRELLLTFSCDSAVGTTVDRHFPTLGWRVSVAILPFFPRRQAPLRWGCQTCGPTYGTCGKNKGCIMIQMIAPLVGGASARTRRVCFRRTVSWIMTAQIYYFPGSGPYIMGLSTLMAYLPGHNVERLCPCHQENSKRSSSFRWACSFTMLWIISGVRSRLS